MVAPTKFIESRRGSDLSVFVSYARSDSGLVEPFVEQLESEGIAVRIDREDIAKSEEWWKRIQQLILEADAVIFAVSPNSIKSDVCQLEAEFAAEKSKRLIPVVISRLSKTQPTLALSKLNYIYLINSSGKRTERAFQSGMSELVDTLRTDVSWIREHTRIGTLAERWQQRAQPSELVLRGAELASAEAWLSDRPKNAPKPSDSHWAFVSQSRRAATKRARNWAIASISTIIVGLFGTYLWYEEYQRAAEETRRAAIREVKRLAEISNSLVEQGDPIAAALIATEAWPLARREEFLPDVAEFGATLYKALHAGPGSWTLNGHQHGVKSAALSPNEKIIATGGNDRTIRLWDASNGQQLTVLSGHFGDVNTLAFSGDGTRLASGSEDGTAILWELPSGRLLARLRGHEGPIWSITFDNAGERLVTLNKSIAYNNEDKLTSEIGIENARLWNARDGSFLFDISPKHALTGEAVKVNHASFLENGDLFVAYGFTFYDFGSGSGKAGIWSGKDGELIQELHSPSPDNPDGSSRAFDQQTYFVPPDRGRYIHWFDDSAGEMAKRAPRIMDSKSGKPLATVEGVRGRDIQKPLIFSRDGARFALEIGKGKDAHLDVRSSLDGSSLCKLHGWVGFRAVSFTAEGMKLLAYAGKHQAFGLFDLSQCKFQAAIRAKAVPKSSDANRGGYWVSSKGQIVLPHYGGVEIIDLDGQTRSASIKADPTDLANFAFFGAVNSLHVLGSRFGTQSWNLTKNRGARKSVKASIDRGEQERAAALQGRRLITYSENSLTVWDTENWAKLYLWRPGSKSDALSWAEVCGDRSALCLKLEAKEVGIVVDLESGKALTPPNSEQHSWWGKYVGLDSNHFLDISSRPVAISDIKSLKPVRKLTALSGVPTSFDVNASRTRLVLNDVRDAYIVELPKGTVTHKLAHEGPVKVVEVSISPDGSRVVTRPSGNRYLDLWDANSGQLIKRLTIGSFRIVSFKMSLDGARVVGLGFDETANIWATKDGSLVASLELIGLEKTRREHFLKGLTNRMPSPEPLKSLRRAPIELSANGEFAYTSGRHNDIPTVWQLFDTDEQLVAHLKEIVPRCLTPVERVAYSLPPKPPAWCITGAGRTAEKDSSKWRPLPPYDTEQWRKDHLKSLTK